MVKEDYMKASKDGFSQIKVLSKIISQRTHTFFKDKNHNEYGLKNLKNQKIFQNRLILIQNMSRLILHSVRNKSKRFQKKVVFQSDKKERMSFGKSLSLERNRMI